MTPVPQESSSSVNERPFDDGERVVISGMSGLYPQSRSVKDFADILYNKINPIGKEGLRYNSKHPEVVECGGSIPDIQRFDAQFFRIHYRLAKSMEPMCQKILEQTYQAIYDAGISPKFLSGKKVGVFTGSCFSETDKALYYSKSLTGFGIDGCSKAMYANRISYWLNAKGPSIAIDESCCSSAEALAQAYGAMTRGECEAAVVTGSFICLHPQYTVHYGRILKLCPDGKTKAFAENADGCAKSEAINVLFLQKAKDAVRIYADVINAKCEFIGIAKGENGPKFGLYREPRATVEFLKKFYEEAQVPPQAVEYVEAVGAGEPEIDKAELDTIDEVFCNNREDTLLVGSVMSNIGYSEAASGIAAVTKVLLGYHTGELAANLHCDRPRQDVACLREGRVRIATEHQTCRRGYVAVNGMSVTGINSHMLLYGYYKPKDLSRYKSSIPYLIPISARQDSAVTSIIENLKSRPVDPEELALLHNIHQYDTSGHLGKGYVILGTDAEQKTLSLGEKSTYFDDARRPLWFVYSGMGSQWPAMGAQLMRIPVFAAAIERCHKVLQPKGLNIIDIISLPDQKMFDNILHSFVGITAIQIGLTDVLNAIGLVPDGIIGHSAGELGSAYADGGCSNTEEIILAAYYRGLVSLQIPFIRGSMAAVGLGYSQIIEQCPPEIEVACRNGPESCTITGPAEDMTRFVGELSAKGIFAKEVPCSNIAYHSRYIANAGPRLLKLLKEMIPNPKPRSKKWVSTSVPMDQWDEPIAQFASAEYYTNNLLSPVLFEEASRLIPKNAVLVEIAPHGLLQAILKRSLSPDCLNIPITRRNHPDNVIMLLNAIGTLYTEGYLVKVQNLYPKVEFPVSTGTPLLSHLVEWSYSEYWPVQIYNSPQWVPSACRKVLISLFDKDHQYLNGNKIKGNIWYPFAAALVSVWDTLAMVVDVPKKQVSVRFRDVYLYSQPTLHERNQLSINIVLHRGTGNFEILANDSTKVATGYITQVNTKTNKITKSIEFDGVNDRAFNSEDIYQCFEDRGYSYSDKFRSIVSVSSNLDQAELVRDDNWVTLIDGMLQLNVLRQPHSGVSVPASIRSLGIDVEEHKQFESLDQTFTNIEYLKKHDLTRGGGVLMESVLFTNLPSFLRKDVCIESLSNSNIDEEQILNLNKPNVTLISKDIGNYNSLQWVEAPEPDQSKGVIVKVKYAGITNTDFKKASGCITYNSEIDNAYGMDFSGVTQSGERVMGMVLRGACSKQIQADVDLLWPVPSHWALEDAATVPLPYLHALYLLVNKGRIEPHMNILVHGGAGALGQAAISVALAHNCTVYTTVSDVRKKRFLLQLFPKLKDECIGNSRDDTFKDKVLLATQGKGCEIIISSNNGSLKHNNLECCAFTGIVIDTNQIQDHANFDYGMAAMFKQRSYCLSDFSNFIWNGDRKEIKELQLMMSQGIARGYVRPLTRVKFLAQETPRAFRLLAASAHRGRVLLDLRSNNLSADRRVTCKADRSQLIISNENSMGIYLAERLITRGARRIYLNIKSEIAGLFQSKIQSWKNQGLEIVLNTSDLKSDAKVHVLLETIASRDNLEGVYIADNQKDEIITALDKVTKNYCPMLKYFAVINFSGDVGKNVCVARRHNSLPATMLLLPKINNVDWSSRNEWYNFAVDAIERALISPGVALDARPLKTSKKPLLQEIAQVAGIKLSENLAMETTIKDIGVVDNSMQLISNFLKNEYNVYYDATQVSDLTIERINALDVFVRQPTLENLEGLSQFFNYVDPDEMVATAELVPVPTLVTGPLVGFDDFDPLKTYLFIVPGLEGLHLRFHDLCKRLKLPALVLQPGHDNQNETLQGLAKKYAEVLIKNRVLNGHFYLMGYESGTAVALELASLLEERGFTGTIFCVGCTNDDFQETLKEALKKYKSENELRDAVLHHMFKLMAGHDTRVLDKALESTRTWKDKVELCVRSLLVKVSHSAQYTRELIETTFARIVQAQNYRVTNRKLRSKIVYLRARGYSDVNLAALQQYSEQPLVVRQLSTPLAHVASDLHCAIIINDCLSPEILDNYDNGNTCELYIKNPDCFTSTVEE